MVLFTLEGIVTVHFYLATSYRIDSHTARHAISCCAEKGRDP